MLIKPISLKTFNSGPSRRGKQVIKSPIMTPGSLVLPASIATITYCLHGLLSQKKEKE